MPQKAPARSLSQSTGELALIDQIRKRSASSSLGRTSVRLGIGDDCAILAPKAGQELLVTTDFSLEGRHFRRDWHSPASIGHRALARGLSDLAAMGAKPIAAFLSLALPKPVAKNTVWIDGFLDGLLALAKQTGVPLAGGDTSESPTDHVLADIVLLGSAASGQALRRSGARAGDLIYVTGVLGGAAAELNALTGTPRAFAQASASDDHPHLFPQPRLAVGQALLKRRLATACIDLSDGLSTDLTHLCEASGVAAELNIAQLPAHPLTTALDDADQIAAVLHGGEDYELLFTASPTVKMPRSIAGVPITQIGRMLKPRKGRAQITVLSGGTRFDVAPQGWEHLR
jgi:thiamine-monophosphate kinase